MADPRLLAASPRCTRALASVGAAQARAGCGTDYLVIQACAVADAYVSEVLHDLVNDWRASSGDKLALRLHKDRWKKWTIPLSWPDRMDWVADLSSSGVKGAQSWQIFRLLLSVRNGLAHAEGELTRMETGPKAVKLLKDIPSKLDIGFIGRKFVYGSNSADLVSGAVRELVLDVDDAVRQSHPHLPFM